jgi:hypothetical protein
MVFLLVRDKKFVKNVKKTLKLPLSSPMEAGYSGNGKSVLCCCTCGANTTFALASNIFSI